VGHDPTAHIAPDAILDVNGKPQERTTAGVPDPGLERWSESWSRCNDGPRRTWVELPLDLRRVTARRWVAHSSVSRRTSRADRTSAVQCTAGRGCRRCSAVRPVSSCPDEVSAALRAYRGPAAGRTAADRRTRSVRSYHTSVSRCPGSCPRLLHDITTIGVAAQSTLGGHDISARKTCMKN